MHMSRKGNDLVRSYLWNAARSAIRHNPVISALYCRLKAKGKRGDVALGQCMRKLLHLVYAVWKTNRPFDPQRFASEQPSDNAMSTTLPSGGVPSTDQPLSAAAAQASATTNETAVGHKRDVPAEEVVTTANTTVAPTPLPVKPP